MKLVDEVNKLATDKGKSALDSLTRLEVLVALAAASDTNLTQPQYCGTVFDLVTMLNTPAYTGPLANPAEQDRLWNALSSGEIKDDNPKNYAGPEVDKVAGILDTYAVGIINKVARKPKLGDAAGTSSGLLPNFAGENPISSSHPIKRDFMPALASAVEAMGNAILPTLVATQTPPAAEHQDPAAEAPAGALAGTAPKAAQAAQQHRSPAIPQRQTPTGPEVPAATDPTEGLPDGTRAALKGMSVSDDQLQEAMDYLNNTPDNHFTSFLVTYHPVLTERAVANLLDGHTTEGSHRNYTPRPQVNKVMIPPAFKMDQSPAIWSRAVIDSLGYPFINFTSPSILELLRGTDPARIRDAYKRVKKMFKQCGLKKPVATLQEFAHASYRNCTLNALVVDANELFSAMPETTVMAQVVEPYSKNLGTRGTLAVPVSFLTAFYGVLSPVAAANQYAALSGKTVEEYRNDLAATGMPPVYVLNPKKVQFRRGPKGSLFHRLFSNKVAPVLVRTRVNTHDGGFLIPEKDADKLLTE